MAMAGFVVIVLCGNATLDDLIHEQKKHRVIAVEVLRFDKCLDYLEYRKKLSAKQKEDITIMFVFGNHDTLMVTNDDDMNGVQERLKVQGLTS